MGCVYEIQMSVMSETPMLGLPCVLAKLSSSEREAFLGMVTSLAVSAPGIGDSATVNAPVAVPGPGTVAVTVLGNLTVFQVMWFGWFQSKSIWVMVKSSFVVFFRSSCKWNDVAVWWRIEL